MTLVFGDVMMDILVKVESALNYGSDAIGSIAIEGGGSAANFASWLSYLDDNVLFIGKIGDDFAGIFLKKDLEKYGVKSILIEGKGEASGKIIILIDKRGERTMITDRGANLTIRASDIPKEFPSNAQHLHLTGYSFFGSQTLLDSTLTILEKCRERGLTVSVDPSSYSFIREFGPQKFLDVTKGIDIIFPNFEEGKILTGTNKEEEIVKSLLRFYPTVVLKLGEKGCIVATDKVFFTIQSRNQISNPDTTGAGDAFAAAFVKGYIKNKFDLKKSGEVANEIASLCVSRKGGRPPLRHSSLEF